MRLIAQHGRGARHQHRPLFLWVSYTAPHRPFEADPAVLSRQILALQPKLRVYAAMVASLDDGVGQVGEAYTILD